MSALVLGGTEAVGRHIVQQLLTSEQWSRVVTVGRRGVTLPADQPGASKLQQVVVDMDVLQAQAGATFSGVDAAFCSLGTPRADAGSAEAFKQVDHGYVAAAAAAAAAAAGVPYFGLVSSQGANAAVPASDWLLLHPLLYMRTKGLAEQAVTSRGFARAALFRPGMLDRGDKARAVEKWFAVLAPLAGAGAVDDVARAMVADVAAFRVGRVSGVGVFEMKALKAAAAAAAGAP